MREKPVDRRKKRRTQKKAEHKPLHKRRIAFYVLFACFVGVVVYVVMYSPFVSIQNIHISGTDRLSQRITVEVQHYLGEQKILGIDGANGIFLDESDLQSTLLESFVQLRDVKVTKNFPHDITIAVDERSDVLIFCAWEIKDEQCVVVDEGGKIIRDVRFDDVFFVENSQIIFLVEEEFDRTVGAHVITEESLRHGLYLIRELPYTLGVQPQSPHHLISLGSAELRLRTDEGWVLYVDMMDDPEVIITILTSFFDQIDAVDERTQLEKVDIRLIDKIFYTFQKSEEEGGETENSVDEDGIEGAEDDVE